MGAKRVWGTRSTMNPNSQQLQPCSLPNIHTAVTTLSRSIGWFPVTGVVCVTDTGRQRRKEASKECRRTLRAPLKCILPAPSLSLPVCHKIASGASYMGCTAIEKGGNASVGTGSSENTEEHWRIRSEPCRTVGHVPEAQRTLKNPREGLKRWPQLIKHTYVNAGYR